ncbi:MAG: HYR domain-containing protein, partial [Phaeodactylibacter sp.]|nr:HYR domain-containing protein [Phaeodactylibacter sp.]
VVTGIAPQFANDNCPADATYSLSGATTGSGTGDASGTTFNAGTTTVTYTYTDGSGNSATCSFEVIVEDDEAPALDCSGINPVRPAAADECSFTMGGTGFDPSWTDNCPGGTLYNDYNYSSSLAGETFPAGVTQVTWTAVDASGNESSCTIDIVIEDAQAPAVDCSGIPTTVMADAGRCSYSILGSGYDPVFGDNCDASITHDYAPAPNPWTLSGATLPAGATTITWTVTDGAGNASVCPATIIVTDGSAPSFVNCPADIIVSTDVGQCEANVNFPTPIAEDACGVTVTQTGGLPSGSMFPVGTTTIEFTATDAAGNSATCTFDVTVEETELPTAVCQDITVSLDATGSVAILPADVDGGSYDNCQVASLAFELGPIIVGQMSFGCNALGDNNVVLRVVDAAGNRDNCVATVTVIDDISPSFTCPDPVTVPGCNAVIPDLTALVNATDNCPNGLTVTQSVPAGLNFGSMNGQSVNITVTVADASGNATSCVVPVTVDDEVPPAFTNCPADITVNNDPDKCGANVWWAAPTAIDNCTGLTAGQASGPAPGSFIAVGSPQTVTYEATDADGNSVTCSFVVAVEDMQLPDLSCPVSFITFDTNNGNCSYTVQSGMLDPDASDNCSVTGLTHNYAAAPSSTTLDGASFPEGMTTVVWTAVDAAGNSISCTMDIMVEDDDTPLVADCPADINTGNDAGECGAIVNYDAPVFNDNCGGTNHSGTLVEGLPSGTLFPVGTTTVTYEYTDVAGNTASCSFDVTITDTQIPDISCPDNIVVGANGSLLSGTATIASFGPCGVTLSYVAPVGTDNCSGAATSLTSGLGIGPNYYQYGGFYTETYTVTDAAGQMATCSFTVTVEDPVPPQITCPQAITVATDPGACDAVVTYANPLGGDNCPGYSISLTHGLPTGSAFPLGTTTVEFTITDGMGNAVSCTFDVTVEDSGAPAINVCPADQTVATSSDGSGDCLAEVPDLTGQLQASDNCTAAGSLLISQSPAAGTLFGGNHGDEQVVTLTVTDANGNASACSATVTVTDDEDPTIDCSSIALNHSTDDDECSYYVNGFSLDPSWSDNCDAVLSHDYAAAPSSHTLNGAILPLGTTDITWTVTDANGNASACSATVTVTDDQDPSALCVPSLTVALDGSGQHQIAAGAINLGSWDNCGPLASALISLDGVNFGGEVTVDCNDTGTPVAVTLQVADQAGNVSTCFVNVTVLDNELPQVSCPGNLYVSTDPGACVAVVNGIAPAFEHDNCDYTVTYALTGATTGSGTDDASGTAFNAGNTIVTYTIEDESGNTATCSFMVIVEDGEAPVAAQCPPSPLVYDTESTSCGKVVNYQIPMFTDNCGSGNLLPGTLTEGLPGGAQFPVGTTTVVYEYTDAAGNTAQCSFDIEVVNNIDPSFVSCPGDIVVQIQNGVPVVTSGAAFFSGAGACGVTLTYTAPVATDNCPDWDVELLSGNGANPQFYSYGGTYTEVYQVEDASGNTAQCSFTITVEDATAPAITCPDDITVTTSPGLCEAEVAYSLPFADDNCPGYTVTQISGPASGAAFPLGTTTVSFQVTDNMGNSTTCSFNVTVVDGEAPEIIACASDQDILTSFDGSGDCLAEVPDLTGQILASDNCTAAAGLSVTQSPAPGTTFGGAQGDEQIVTITVTDAAGNASACLATVTLIDDEAPVLDCSAVTTALGTDANMCATLVSGTSLDPSWTDNCSADLSHDYAPAPSAHTLNGAVLPAGTTTVVWTVTDENGNADQCTVTYTVADDDAPQANCQPNLTVTLNGNGEYTLPVTLVNNGSSDNCGIAGTEINGGSSVLFTCADAGNTVNVTLTVTDAAGNASTCSATVTVLDTDVPQISCPVDVSITAETGECSAVVNDIEPKFIDDNCPATITYVLMGATTGSGVDDASGTAFNVGTTTVMYTITDESGNSAACGFEVTVTDDEAPVLDCSNIDPVRSANADECSFTMGSTGFDPAGFSDNCPGATLSNDYNYSSSLAGETFPAGITTVTWTVTDAAGNTTSCTIDIEITDDQDPVVDCTGIDGNLSVDAGQCSKVVTDDSLDPLASDNCPGVSLTHDYLAAPHLFTLEGAEFPAGQTVVTWTATDAAGNTATCVITVDVAADQDPVFLSCPTDITVNTATDLCGATANWAPPVVLGNCGAITPVQTAGPPSGSLFPAGTTTIEYTATDAFGNTAICSFTVTVEDSQAPDIDCPVSFITLGASNGNCDNSIPDDMLDALASDNCGVVSLTHDFAGAPDNTTLAGADFPLGVTVVTWTAVDAAGNSVSCSLEVTVVDDIVPMTVNCPADISVSNDPGECSAIVSYDAPAFSTGCNGVPVSGILVQGLPSGSAFPAGTTIVRYEYTDANGTAVCSFTVTVEDAEDPVIGCPVDIVVGADGSIASGNATIISTGPCGVTLRYTAPVGTDNCPNPVTTLSGGLGANPNYYQHGGTYTETYTVTDASGNTAICSFTITVEDPIVPTITCPQEDITVSTQPGLCSAVVTYASPLGSDNCPGYSISLTQGLNSGAAFPLGTTTVEFTITDNAGNSNTCSFDVNVIDNEDPVIVSCAPDQDVPTSSDGTGDCSGAIPDLTGQVNAADNCTIASITQNPAAGASFGSAHGDQQVVTITVTDQDGNSVTCTATVTLVDDENPIITNCADDQNVLVSSNGTGDCEALIPDLTDEVAANDNCSEFANLTITQSPLAGTAFNGAHGDQQVVTITVTDEVGNSTACDVTLTLVDDEDPTILACAADQDVLSSTGNPGDCEGLVPDLTDEVTADDNCSPSTNLTITQSPAAGTAFGSAHGDQQTVVITVTDEAGNSTTCSVTLTLVDDENPTILACAADQDVLSSTGNPGDCEGLVPDLTDEVTADDNCSASANLTITQSPAAGTPFGNAHGDQQVIVITVTDEVGNSATCEATLTLSDDENPVILECVPDQIVSATANGNGDCEGLVPDLTGQIVGDDNCTDAANLTVTQSPVAGTPFGNVDGDQQVVTFTVTDEAGNSVSCQATITLYGDEEPTILACVADQDIYTGNDDCEGVIPDLTGQVTAIDNCTPVNELIIVQNPAAGTVISGFAGTQQVITFTVIDGAGNSVSCEATLTLVDDDAPVIASCAPDQDVLTSSDGTGDCAAEIPDLTAQISATDNCTDAASLTITQSPAAGTPFGSAHGDQQTVTFTVTDGSGNSTTCSTVLTLVDDEAPVLDCPDDITTALFNCVPGIPPTWTVAATDNCSADVTPVQIAGPTPGTALTLGVYTVTYAATDDVGNVSNCSFTINVTQGPSSEPIIVYPSQDIYVELDVCDGGSEEVCFEVTATDACDGDLVPVVTVDGQVLTPVNGNRYCYTATAAGTFTVLITAEDGSGNIREEDFRIIVTESLAPQPTNLLCNYNVNATLDANCQRFITSDMVLEGSFGCLTEDDFVVTIVNDDDPTNGNILDGCGAFIYEVTLAPGVGPVSGFEPCWGYITGEDKAAPSMDCPDDTDQGSVIFECFTQDGTLEAGDLQMVPLNFSCFIDGSTGGSSIDPGIHYYDLIPFQVDRTDYYTILVTDDFSSAFDETAIAIFQGGFNPSNPCENIIAFVDEPIDDFNPPLANDEPYLRISLPLIAGETYYLWVTSDEDGATGDYTVDICPDENGQVGLFGSTTVLDPQTWEPVIVNNDQLWPARDVSLTLDLYCGDFDLIFNNPASLAITGAPTVSDNCDQDVEVTFVDTYANAGDCAPIIITRTFTAVDDKGNTRTCTQLITLNRPDEFDVEFPPRTAPIECDEQYATLPNGNPAPSVTGYPFIVTVNGIVNLTQEYCNLGASFVDRTPVNVCSGSFKFVRDWTVIDWCNGDNIAEDEQVIKVGDFTPPAVTCPSEDYDWDGQPDGLVFSTSPFNCTASFAAPLPEVTDNCSDWEVYTEILAEVEVEVFNQYGQVTGTALDTVVVRTIAWNATTRIVSGIEAGSYYFRYVVEDACGNTVTSYCPFEVRDEIEPTAVCNEDLTISIGGNGLARLYAADIDEGSNDNCGIDRIEARRSGVVLDQFGQVVPFECGDEVSPWSSYIDFYCCDAGETITIELRVTDFSGNVNTCWLEVVPEEKVKPYCYAPANVEVGCGELPYSFDATDTLQLQQLFGVAVAEDNCGGLMVQELPPVVNLDCGAGTIIRRFKAIDAAGNQSVNFCQQTITVGGAHNYEIRFPADAEAVCGVAEPDSVIYEEIGCDLLAVSHTDETFSASGDECYKVFRTWKVLNWCQYDGVSDPFIVGRDEDCDNQPGDEAVWVLHRPGGKTYIDRDNDETEPNNVPLAFQNVCNGIDDFWRKVDYDGGFYQYTQVIKVYDDIDPQVLYSQPEPFCSIDNVECTGLVGLPFQVDENCTPDDLSMQVFLDAGADGNIDADLLSLADGLFDDFTLTGAYPDYQLNGRFPIGNHTFEIRVEDGCGNRVSRRIPFEVVDCKAPAITCLNGLAIDLMPVDLDGDNIPDEGQMAIWASDFITSPMDDCSGPVTYSINRFGEAPHVDSTNLIVSCADTGNLFVQVWAYDAEGNADVCETYLLVQDNFDACNGIDSLLSVSGIIATEEDNTVEDVEVSLSGQGNDVAITGADGLYGFGDVLEGYDYTITPMRDGDYLNGVSTFDLVLISKHILGVQPLDSPYKIIAADINRSRTITTLDMILLRKLILSIDTEFSNNTSWRFVERAYVFPNPANPWLEEFPEAISINNLPAGGLANQDFVAVKVGDVTMDAVPNSLLRVQNRTSTGAFTLQTGDIALKAGQEYTVAFTAAGLADVAGYQATLVFDNSSLELVDIVPGAAREENFGLRYVGEGLVTTSWHRASEALAEAPTANSEHAMTNTDMFSLVFRARAEAQLSNLLSVSSGITRAEAYTREGRYMDVAIGFRSSASAKASADKFELYQNRPNPFREEAVIGFYLPQPAKAVLTISDVSGKVVRLIRLDGVRGYNSVTLRRDGLPAGVLQYTVKTDEYTDTRTMVITD